MNANPERSGDPTPAAHQRLLSRLTDPRWYWMLMPAVLLVFVIGVWGYLSYEEGAPGVSDAVYGAAKLFFLHAAPQPETHVGLALDIARFVAPVLAGWAALIAVVSIFRDRVQQLLIPLKRGHVVICGLGYVGFEFARQLRHAGYNVVIVEAEEDNPHIAVCRGWGFPVVIGDAQLKPTLEAVGVKHADRLLAVTSDSVVNTEIITLARHLADDGPRSGRNKLRCLARVDDPDLCVLLRTAEANQGDDEPTMDFFSPDESGARLLLDEYPPATDHRPHIVVAHPGSLGTGLIFDAARRWRDECGGAATPLVVTVVDDDAEQRVQTLLADYPVLEQACEFHCCSTTARDLERIVETGTAPPISQVYVTADRDERTIATALKLRQSAGSAVPVVAALSRAYAIGELIERQKLQGGRRIAVFRTLERSCTVELVEGGSFEAIAHEIHRRYCRMQIEGRRPAPPWSQLDAELQRSSRAQARHIGVKLRSIGCEIAPLRDWRATEFAFTDAELDALTIMEHDRWQREKEADGWTLGPKDDVRRTHPDLVPWHELPADVADWDRQFILAIPTMLAAVGLQIVDVRGMTSRYPAVDAGLNGR